MPIRRESSNQHTTHIAAEVGAINGLERRERLKAELKRRNVSYRQLAEKLEPLGIHETEKNSNNKISCGDSRPFFRPMPALNRLLVYALGGWLAFGLPPSFALGQSQDQGRGDEQADKQSAADGSLLGRLPFFHSPEPSITCAYCSKAGEELKGDREENDLRAQWWMAYAAWAVAGIAVFQTFIVIAGLVGLYFTIRHAKATADETRRSADAAMATVRATQGADRPYLMPINPTLANWHEILLGNVGHVEVHFGIENLGKGVGFLLSYEIAHEICEDGKQGQVKPETRDQIAGLPISAGGTRTFGAAFDVFAITPTEVDEISDFRQTLYAYGSLRYQDVFGVIRRTGFAFEFIPNVNAPEIEREEPGFSWGEFAICTDKTLWFDVQEELEKSSR